MCSVLAGAVFKDKLPIHTPTSALGESITGGRSYGEISGGNMGGIFIPPKKQKSTPSPTAKTKKTSSNKNVKTTGGGLRINNTKLSTGLQLK